MANPEHLSILKKGTTPWNEWRRRNPGVQPDLSGADLEAAYLSETSPDWTEPNPPEDLAVINLTKVNLSEANLRYAILKGAELRSANLLRTNLMGANLRRADLSGANLTRARLYHSNLTLANLSRTDLEGAMFWETILARVNFSRARGLDSCRHGGPSIIDHRTLLRSGPLPTDFLRGCGLPEIVIEHLPEFFKSRLGFPSSFISYSGKDQEFADQLYADLQNKGVRCWFAPEDLKIGDPFRQRIDEAIRAQNRLLIVLSEYSVQSAWVEKEVETAFEEERRRKIKILFPITIDGAVMTTSQAWAADIRRTRHIGDFSKWRNRDSYHEALARLLRDLRMESSQLAGAED